MEAKLRQETENQAISTTKNGYQKIWEFIMKKFKELSRLEIVVFFLNTVLLMIMFGAGIKTMIQEATAFFPIHEGFKYFVGFALMAIVVMGTHIVTKLTAEVAFNWWRYTIHYKVFLFITNSLLIFLCWGVQSEGGEIINTAAIEAKIAAIEADSTSSGLAQLDSSIQQVQVQQASVSENIAFIQQLRSERKKNFLNIHEMKILQLAQSSQQQLSQQRTTLAQSRIEEQKRMSLAKTNKITDLKQELQQKINKGRSKAGLAEGLLVFITFFMMAYKNRFKVYKAEETPIIQEFPKGLKIEERMEMLPEIKPLGYDEEEKHLLVDYQGKQYYFAMEGFIHAAKGNRRKYDVAVEKNQVSSRNTKLKNIEFYEKITAMTGLTSKQIFEDFNYQVMYSDWFSTTETSLEPSPETVEKRVIPLRTA